jgi:hypothetical protein
LIVSRIHREGFGLCNLLRDVSDKGYQPFAPFFVGHWFLEVLVVLIPAARRPAVDAEAGRWCGLR